MKQAMKQARAELGQLEGQVMQLIWRNSPVTAEAVRKDLGQGLKDSTVRTVLRRLEQKGYVRHTVDNRTFLYSPTEDRRKVAARAVKGIVDWFCNGSVDEVLVGMVDAKMLDRTQLERLAKKIDAAKRAGKKRTSKGD
jgi:predicted transcriptional regulator